MAVEWIAKERLGSNAEMRDVDERVKSVPTMKEKEKRLRKGRSR